MGGAQQYICQLYFQYNYNTILCSADQTEIIGPRRRARAFFRILPAYSIIILDHHGVVIKFQRSKYTVRTGSPAYCIHIRIDIIDACLYASIISMLHQGDRGLIVILVVRIQTNLSAFAQALI